MTPIHQAAEKKTAFFEEHKKAQARIVEFGGWLMPVSYEGTLAEHQTVREKCGMFDVSHMGEIFVRGKNAEAFSQHVTINDVTKLQLGQAQYSAILNEKGGMIDDLLVYKLKEDEFLFCANASNTDKDFAWIKSQGQSFGGVTVENESPSWSQLAIQGPNSCQAVMAVIPRKYRDELQGLKYTHMIWAELFGKKVLIARTGYTGELGYELYLPHEIASKTWQEFLKTAPTTGLKPIGLGARDTLRLEACYLLYGNDMNETVTPLEAGISWATKMNGPSFIGKSVLEKQKSEGLKRKICAFKMTEEKAIPRHDMDVYFKGELAGKVTSGSVLPTLGGAGGMSFLSSAIKEGDTIEVDIRGKRKSAKIVKRPLYTAKVAD